MGCENAGSSSKYKKKVKAVKHSKGEHISVSYFLLGGFLNIISNPYKLVTLGASPSKALVRK